jgi:CHAT domain-containing protein
MAADSLFESGRYETAESLYRNILKDPGDNIRAGAEKGLGNISFVYGRYDQADKSYRMALELFRKIRDPRGEAKTLINLGNLSFLRSDFPAARKSYEKAIVIIRQLKEPGAAEQKDLLAAEANLGQINMIIGNRELALVQFRNALQAAREIGNPAIEADNLQNVGNFYQQTGEPDSAVKYYEEAVNICMQTGYFKRAADAMREMGSIHRRTGEYDRAYTLTYQALALLFRIKKGDYMPGEGEIYNNLGLLFLDMGNYRSALENFTSGLKAFRYLGDSIGVGKAEENLGNAYLRLSARDSSYYDSSQFFYDQARRIGDQPIDQADYYNNLGVLCEIRGRYTAARDNYSKARKTYESAKDHVGVARVLNNLANIALRQNDYGTAVKDYEAALAGIRKYRRRDWEASLLANLGNAQHQSGKLNEALRSLSQAVEIVERLRQGISSQEFRSQYFENKIAIYEELVGLYVQKGMAREAFKTAERAKARAFLDLLAGAGEIGYRADLNPEVKALIARERDLEKKIEFLTGDSAQPRAIMEHDSVLLELIDAFPDYRALKSGQPITVEELQSRLDDRTAIVEYFLGQRTGFVFTITRGRLSVRRLDANPLTIYENVDSLRKIIRAKKDYARYGRALYDILVAPLRSEIGTAERLCIVPHSALHHLPFAALIVKDEPRRLLIEDYDIFYSPSASVYALAKDKNRRKSFKSAIFAKSSFAEHPDWFDIPLPGTNAEKDSLLAARVMPGVTVFSDVDAKFLPTETNAKRHAGEYDILHFATHGKLDADSPLDSRIVLSADSIEDGNLKVREIFNLKLNAYLVTLSACQTGQVKAFTGTGKYAVGDELTGLSRAFIYAGAPSVVASLWKVSDAATVLLMVNFYKNLKSQDKTRALCAAQRTLMKSEYYGAPFYWAPFVVIGDGD